MTTMTRYFTYILLFCFVLFCTGFCIPSSDRSVLLQGIIGLRTLDSSRVVICCELLWATAADRMNKLFVQEDGLFLIYLLTYHIEHDMKERNSAHCE